MRTYKLHPRRSWTSRQRSSVKTRECCTTGLGWQFCTLIATTHTPTHTLVTHTRHTLVTHTHHTRHTPVFSTTHTTPVWVADFTALHCRHQQPVTPNSLYAVLRSSIHGNLTDWSPESSPPLFYLPFHLRFNWAAGELTLQHHVTVTGHCSSPEATASVNQSIYLSEYPFLTNFHTIQYTITVITWRHDSAQQICCVLCTQ